MLIDIIQQDGDPESEFTASLQIFLNSLPIAIAGAIEDITQNPIIREVDIALIQSIASHTIVIRLDTTNKQTDFTIQNTPPIESGPSSQIVLTSTARVYKIITSVGKLARQIIDSHRQSRHENQQNLLDIYISTSIIPGPNITISFSSQGPKRTEISPTLYRIEQKINEWLLSYSYHADQPKVTTHYSEEGDYSLTLFFPPVETLTPRPEQDDQPFANI